MTRERRPAGSAASVRARLLELSRREGLELQLVLSDFAIERLLYRLGASRHGESYVLKGATLFRLWSDERGRATWDLDLLGTGASSVGDVATVVRALCALEAGDGIVFDAKSVTGEEIRASDEYAGVRVRLEARLAEARVPVQVDVAFGDAVVPAPTRETYPTLLDHPAPRILVYPREAVVAEKLEAMLSLGVTNSRMKDFHDVHRLAASFAFDGETLVRAICATFERRRAEIPDGEPLVLAPGFLAAPERRTQWRALVRRGRLRAPEDVEEVLSALRRFLLPLLVAARTAGRFTGSWPPGGPWLVEPSTRTSGR